MLSNVDGLYCPAWKNSWDQNSWGDLCLVGFGSVTFTFMANYYHTPTYLLYINQSDHLENNPRYLLNLFLKRLRHLIHVKMPHLLKKHVFQIFLWHIRPSERNEANLIGTQVGTFSRLYKIETILNQNTDNFKYYMVDVSKGLHRASVPWVLEYLDNVKVFRLLSEHFIYHRYTSLCVYIVIQFEGRFTWYICLSKMIAVSAVHCRLYNVYLQFLNAYTDK